MRKKNVPLNGIRFHPSRIRFVLKSKDWQFAVGYPWIQKILRENKER